MTGIVLGRRCRWSCLRWRHIRSRSPDVVVAAFSYVPFWGPHRERMHLRLRAEMPQRVTVPGADLVIDLASGEEIQVEISTKFRPDQLRARRAEPGPPPGCP